MSRAPLVRRAVIGSPRDGIARSASRLKRLLLRDGTAAHVAQRALEAAADRLYREAAQARDNAALADDVTPSQRRADALSRLAESALADLDRGTAGDHHQVMWHVEASAAAVETEREQAVVELGHPATSISAETSARLVCDASPVVMHHGEDGSVLDVGRKTRIVPPAIRRALDFFTAVKEQLGLQLIPEEGPLEVLVIDRIMRSTDD